MSRPVTTVLHDACKDVWGNLPAALAFSLLAIQIAIPWTVPHFVTQDGPSHVYNAIVIKKLLLHQQPFTSVYSINDHIIPNWASTILFGIACMVAGSAHAEPLIMSFVLVVGFFSLSYAVRSFSPTAPRWTPISNFLLQTWCLWMGFYNFYLGIVLVPFAIGYYVRRGGKLTAKSALALGGGLIVLFFVHLLPAAIAMLSLAIFAIWLHIVRPRLSRNLSDHPYDMRQGIRQIGLLAAAMSPVLLLGLLYRLSTISSFAARPGIVEMAMDFPLQAFVTASGLAAGQQWRLWPVVLGLIVIAILAMRSSEWRSAKGALAVSAFAIFVVYLLVPDSGLGGLYAKVRFAWAAFLLGGLLAMSATRLQPLRTPIAIFVAACLALNLASTARGLREYSKAVEDYLSAMSAIRPGSRILRVRYPTQDLANRYGFHEVEDRDPLLHLDAYESARLDCLDVSDYQAGTTYFPVVYNSDLNSAKQSELFELEHPKQDETIPLDSIRKSLPVKIDYAIVVGDDSPADGSSASKLMAKLDSSMRLVGQSSFVHVYETVDGH